MKTRKLVSRQLLYRGLLSALIVFIAAALFLALLNPQFPYNNEEGTIAEDAANTQGLTSTQATPSNSVATATGQDTYLEKQWALANINVQAGWENLPNGEVRVAILDTGIDSSHEDLHGVVEKSVNFTQSNTVNDIYGHGTHIAGIIAARANNGIGIAGAYPHVKLLNVKIADDCGNCSSTNVADGIIWASDNGAAIINLSLAITRPSSNLQRAVEYAYNKGAVIVAAAGNERNPVAKIYPAIYDQCIAVVGTNNADMVISRFAIKQAIAAPGYHILSTLPGDNYGYKDGSSMATGYVSAAAAIAWNLLSKSAAEEQINSKIHRLLIKSTYSVLSNMLTYHCIDFGKLAEVFNHRT